MTEFGIIPCSGNNTSSAAAQAEMLWIERTFENGLKELELHKFNQDSGLFENFL